MTKQEKIHAPLTAEEFRDGCGYTFRDVSIVEDENAYYVFAFGHVDPDLYAEVVNDYDRELAGLDPEDAYTAKDVTHRWAVTLAPPDAPDGWFISWSDEHQENPLRFPVTLVQR